MAEVAEIWQTVFLKMYIMSYKPLSSTDAKLNEGTTVLASNHLIPSAIFHEATKIMIHIRKSIKGIMKSSLIETEKHFCLS